MSDQAYRASQRGGRRRGYHGVFSSAALGAAHRYGSKMTHQTNLEADMMAAASGGSSATAGDC